MSCARFTAIYFRTSTTGRGLRTVDIRKNVEGAQFFLPVSMIVRAAGAASAAGWQLDWCTVRGETNDQASRAASEQRDFMPLCDMFDQIVSEATPQGERDSAWRAAERARLSFPTSGTETTHRPQNALAHPPQTRRMHIPGQHYGGPGNSAPEAGR